MELCIWSYFQRSYGFVSYRRIPSLVVYEAQVGQLLYHLPQTYLIMYYSFFLHLRSHHE